MHFVPGGNYVGVDTPSASAKPKYYFEVGNRIDKVEVGLTSVVFIC